MKTVVWLGVPSAATNTACAATPTRIQRRAVIMTTVTLAAHWLLMARPVVRRLARCLAPRRHMGRPRLLWHGRRCGRRRRRRLRGKQTRGTRPPDRGPHTHGLRLDLLEPCTQLSNLLQQVAKLGRRCQPSTATHPTGVAAGGNAAIADVAHVTHLKATGRRRRHQKDLCTPDLVGVVGVPARSTEPATSRPEIIDAELGLADLRPMLQLSGTMREAASMAAPALPLLIVPTQLGFFEHASTFALDAACAAR
mmetsp:Transcript_32410/g.94892  ORF Transcript_32410/g.94892 Transcript_32410/m.94892 type:complete len:252 (+) Transcript_32410:219-974(+)